MPGRLKTRGCRAPRIVGLAILIALPAALLAQNPFTLSEKEELELGRAAAGQIEKDILLVEDPAVVKFIDDIGQALVRKSGRTEIAYSFKVVDSPEINAFALPGGFVYVNRGLIEAAQTPDELAGVLAHEIGHVVHRHGAEQAGRANMAQTGLGVLGGLLGRGTKASVGQMAAQMVTTGVFMKFSRQAERDADQVGARMLYEAGFRPQGMVSFFDRLAEMQKTEPNAVLKFFSSHPSPTERSANIASLIAGFPVHPQPVTDDATFRDVKRRLAAMPRPEVEAAKAAAAIAAAALPPAEPAPEVRARNLARDREIAARFAPVFHQALGPAPRFDYITNFDFDDDWRGDNNWENAGNRRFPLKAYVYYAVFETRTHLYIHYAAFHPRDYKGGEQRGALLSEALRLGAGIGGQYDPTGRSNELVMAHENDLEGALVIAEKSGENPAAARLAIVETLAHNHYLKYTPRGSPLVGDPVQVDGVRPLLFVEPKGHGIEAWRDDAFQRKQAEKGFMIYRYAGSAGDPDSAGADSVGYDLLPTYETFWQRTRAGKNDTFGLEHDYAFLSVRFAEGTSDAERHIRLGVMGSALNGLVGGAHMSRPPWGWFDGEDRDRPLGEWFLQPAETARRRWNQPESFSTTYTYHPFLGQFR
ncbi:MAG: M48 family metalloprotease [Bryobacteraceae bacterium]|nr:M48 family metalloprotease [Bryobacteraceae bacterium]